MFCGLPVADLSANPHRTFEAPKPMHPIRNTIAALTLMLLCGVEVTAADREQRTNWANVGRQITGRKVSTVLIGGTAIEGKVITVKSDALTVRIDKTSDAAAFHGTTDVPRAQIKVL